jgi:Fe-S-cluster containining protein
MGDFSKSIGRRSKPLRTPTPLPPRADAAAAEDAVVAAARAFVRRPDGALALRLVSDVGTLLDRRGAADPAAARRACAPGCAHCCHMPVSLSPPEALLIHTHVLEHWPADRRAALVAALAEAERAAAGEDDAALFRARRACVFLDGDSQRCTIYAVRPLACRGHASFDRQACADAHEAPADAARAARVPTDEGLRAEKDRIKTTLGVTLIEARRDPLDYELSSLLRAVFADPEIGQRWLSGRAGELPCRVLGPGRVAHAELTRLAAQAREI